MEPFDLPLSGTKLTTFDPSELRADFRDEGFWKRETPRFLAFARSQILRHRWRGSYGGPPAGGEEEHDYVVRAAALILDGQRCCPPNIDSVPFVLGVIRSLITHDAEKPENRQFHAVVPNDLLENPGEQLVDERTSVEELLAAADLARDFVESLPESHRAYVTLLISGRYSSAAEYAAHLGVTVAEIRAMDKVIRRRRSVWKGTAQK